MLFQYPLLKDIKYFIQNHLNRDFTVISGYFSHIFYWCKYSTAWKLCEILPCLDIAVKIFKLRLITSVCEGQVTTDSRFEIDAEPLWITLGGLYLMHHLLFFFRYDWAIVKTQLNNMKVGLIVDHFKMKCSLRLLLVKLFENIL